MGTKISQKKVPAVGWQDDITILASNDKEEKTITKNILQSAKENKITFSEEKCKYIIIGKKENDFTETYFGERKIERVKEGKVLGYIFSEENSNDTHIDKKIKEGIEMVAALGLTINNSTLSKVSIKSMMILYRSCIIPKIMYGLAAFKITTQQMEKLDITERRIMKSVASLPQSTTKIALYNEFGIIPITYKMKMKKIMMFHRMISRLTENEIIKNTICEQVMGNYSWFQQVTTIANELDINIDQAKELSKGQMKCKVKEAIKLIMKNKIQKEIENTKQYKEIAHDEITPGVVKKYMSLEKKMAQVVCRARTGTLDPEPRKPNWDTIWKCKLCVVKKQTSYHYIAECTYTRNIFQDDTDRKNSWKLLQTLNGTDTEIELVARKLKRIEKLIKQTD